MVYKNHFVASIMVGDKTLRENGKFVTIPFQSEYSILLKNQHSRRAIVNIVIDGQHITPDGLLVDKHSKIKLERFVESDRKFKFIKKTKDISKHLGDNVADGEIVIKYSFENNIPSPIRSPDPYFYNPYRINPYRINYDITRDSVIFTATNTVSDSLNNVVLESGITVEGSKSNQVLKTVPSFDVENEEYEIIFHLIGGELLTTKTKKICSSCGKKIKSNFEYCPHDGTYLR